MIRSIRKPLIGIAAAATLVIGGFGITQANATPTHDGGQSTSRQSDHSQGNQGNHGGGHGNHGGGDEGDNGGIDEGETPAAGSLGPLGSLALFGPLSAGSFGS